MKLFIKRVKRTIYLLLTAPIWIPVFGIMLWLSAEDENPYELRYNTSVAKDGILEAEWNCYKFRFRKKPWLLR